MGKLLSSESFLPISLVDNLASWVTVVEPGKLAHRRLASKRISLALKVILCVIGVSWLR